MAVRWNAKKLLNIINSGLQGDYSPEAHFARPMRQLKDAVAAGKPLPLTQFEWLSLWYSNSGVAALFTNVYEGLRFLHQSVYFAAGDIAFFSRRWVALAGNSGGISDNDAALNVARAIWLGCMDSARQMVVDLLREPRALDNVRRENSVLPQFVLNLCYQAGLISAPTGVYSAPVGEPYGSLLGMLKASDPNTLTQPIIAACDYHVAQCRSMNNKETPEFWQTSFQLNPVEILAFLRVRESLGLECPALSHPVVSMPAGKLYPPMRVEPDPIIAPDLQRRSIVNLGAIALCPLKAA